MQKHHRINWQIGVGDPNGHHSAVWKIKAAKNKADLYIMARSLGQEMKASIHASGARHVGLTAEQHRKEVAEGSWTAPTRHHDQWLGGTPVLPGLSLEFVLRFPVGQLRCFPLSAEERVTFWVPAPPPLSDQVLDVSIYLADRPMHVELTPVAHHSCIAVGYLGDGKAVVLITQARTVGPPTDIDLMASDIAQDAKKRGITPENVRSDQRVVIGFSIGHIRAWADYALDTFLPHRRVKKSTSDMTLPQ